MRLSFAQDFLCIFSRARLPHPIHMAARKIDGRPLEMNRLFPPFPSLPPLNHFAAAAAAAAASGIGTAAAVPRARADWLRDARGEEGRGGEGRGKGEGDKEGENVQ